MLLHNANMDSVTEPCSAKALDMADTESFRTAIVHYLVARGIFKMFFFFLKSYCLFKNGFTPGKYLLNLRVVACHHVHDHMRNNRVVQITPGTRPSLKS